MENIPKPTSIESIPVDGQTHRASIVVSPCYPGYGTTLGNALRRVLLSSLPGAAATAIKIKGVDHEFSSIEHVKEDVVEMILNIKSIRFRMHTEEPVELTLEVKGEKVVTAGDFESNSEVEVVNADQVIATLTDKAANFTLKVIVQRGRGYVPVESREGEKLDVGYIAIDSIYTPVQNVNFRTENVRVGQMTNFDKLILDVTTDGTVSPEDAFRQSVDILVEQFSSLTQPTVGAEEAETAMEEVEVTEAAAETNEAEAEETAEEPSEEKGS
jgi:DNA-directed RNA polymerase subunit alpha